MLMKDNIFQCPSARFRPTSNLHQLRISPWFSNNIACKSRLNLHCKCNEAKKAVAHGFRYNGVCDDIMNIGGSQCATTPILP